MVVNIFNAQSILHEFQIIRGAIKTSRNLYQQHKIVLPLSRLVLSETNLSRISSLKQYNNVSIFSNFFLPEIPGCSRAYVAKYINVVHCILTLTHLVYRLL